LIVKADWAKIIGKLFPWTNIQEGSDSDRSDPYNN
jgi:hypothetical protein